MSFLTDLISGIFDSDAADKVADTQVQATQAANKTAMDMFNRSTALSMPGMQAGWNALAEQGLLLGQTNMVPQSAINSALSATQQGANTIWSQYGQQNPDVVQYFRSHPEALAQFGGDMNAALEYHYNTFGQHEGRALPSATGAGASSGGMTVGGGQEQTADAAYNRFLGGGFNRAMTDVTNNDMDQLRSAFGAAGSSVSGSAQGAMMDRLARNRYTAFSDHYGALSGISGTGAQLSSQAGANALTTGQSVARNQLTAGDARASSYQTRSDNTSRVINSGVNALAGGFGYGGSPGYSGGWIGR